MPRKPNPPPAIFRIEGMSDGIDRRLVDDFSGELLPQPIRPVVDPQIAIDARKRLVRDNQRALLEATGIIKTDAPRTPKAQLVAPHIHGKRAIQFSDTLAIMVDKPSWRRS